MTFRIRQGNHKAATFRTGHVGLVIALAVALLGSVVASGIEAPAAQRKPLAIRGARLIDGTGAPPREAVTILIEGDRITAVGPAAQVKIPADAQVIDGTGKTVLPGLIDTHVHFRDHLPELFLAHGVTTVRDAGNPPEWILVLKEKEASGEMRGPRIFAVGNILDAPPPLRGHHIAVATPEAAREAARMLIGKGVDGIKVYEKITPALLRPIVEEVHAANKRVIGHITFSAREAALVGIDGLEHATGIAVAVARDPAQVAAIEHSEGVFGYRFMDTAKADDVIRVLVDRRVAVVPALATWARGAPQRAAFQAEAARILAGPEFAGMPAEPQQRLKSYGRAQSTDAEKQAYADDYRALGEFLRRFARAGGRIVVGTDGGVLWGLSVHHELQLLVDVGLSPVQAIKAATGDAAELIQARDLGTIGVGKLADVMLVDGNPAEHIEDTKRLVTMIKRGVVTDTRVHPDYKIPVPRPPIEGSGH